MHQSSSSCWISGAGYYLNVTNRAEGVAGGVSWRTLRRFNRCGLLLAGRWASWGTYAADVRHSIGCSKAQRIRVRKLLVTLANFREAEQRHCKQSGVRAKGDVALVLSSALARAVKWGLVGRNPAEDSEPPKMRKKDGVTLTPQQQSLVLSAAAELQWVFPVFLELATGARRGEVLALRRSDICDGRPSSHGRCARQKAGSNSRGRKRKNLRVVALPGSALAISALTRSNRRSCESSSGRTTEPIWISSSRTRTVRR